jgi:hypothetical protein
MAIGFSWGSTNLSFAFIIYILVSVTSIMYLVKYMYTQNKPISAMIVLILLILVFIFFGRRWFQYGQLKGSTAWAQANAAQSGQTTTLASGQCSDGSAATSTNPSMWPPVVNKCPDFMILNASGACVDTNRLYGSTSIGQTTIANGASKDATCTAVTSDETKNKYLRWEGVVESEGSCKKENIGKAPVN